MSDERRLNVSVSGLGGMGWVFLAVVLFTLVFEAEIRCSLGNAKECAKMQPVRDIKGGGQ